MSKTRVVHVSDNVPGAVYIGRAMPRLGLAGSLWANPHKIGNRHGNQIIDREMAIDLYRIELDFWFHDDPEGRKELLGALAGKPLACWCRHDGEARTDDNACHGDVLVELIGELGLERQP